MVNLLSFVPLLMKATNVRRPLLDQKYPYAKLLKRVQPITNLRPLAGYLEKPKSLLFHPDNIMKHKEVIPIIVIVFIGMTCELLYSLRQAFTRDDVWYTKGVAPCEYVETRPGVHFKAPIRKFIVFNQKYEYPPGLLEAVRCEQVKEE